MQGCKRARVETVEGTILSKTEGVDADMKTTAYKRPGALSLKPVGRVPGQGTIKRKADELSYT